jgi:hypothetical protein
MSDSIDELTKKVGEETISWMKARLSEAEQQGNSLSRFYIGKPRIAENIRIPPFVSQMEGEDISFPLHQDHPKIFVGKRSTWNDIALKTIWPKIKDESKFYLITVFVY